MSTVCRTGPVQEPPSSTRSDLAVHHAEDLDATSASRLSGEIRAGGDQRVAHGFSSDIAIWPFGWRIASRPVFPVTLRGTREEPCVMMVSGPGQKRRPAGGIGL